MQPMHTMPLAMVALPLLLSHRQELTCDHSSPSVTPTNLCQCVSRYLQCCAVCQVGHLGGQLGAQAGTKGQQLPLCLGAMHAVSCTAAHKCKEWEMALSAESCESLEVSEAWPIRVCYGQR